MMNSRLHPPQNPSHGRFSKLNIYITSQGDCISGQDGNFGSRGRGIGLVGRYGSGRRGLIGRGGCKVGNDNFENGIGIYDVTH